MKMQMIPPILNDTGDCCCQNCPQCNNCGCVPGGDGCICQGDKSGNSIESAITCDLVWKEKQLNGKYKYYKVVSGSSQQNMPVVLPTATLTKRGVVQLTNELSDREDIALTPKGAKDFKTQLDKETADRINADNNFQSKLDKEKNDRANADADLLNKINQEETDRTNADKSLSDRITQETADRKKADSALSSSISNVNNKVTNIESKVDSAISKANKAVTSVTSDGNATVTVTKADGTSSNFTINNVAHATSADSATNADHADIADKVKDLDTNQLGKVSLLSSRTGDGNWTLSNVVVNKPIFITHNAGAYPGGCHLTVVSGSNDLKTTHHFGTWAVLLGQLLTTIGAGACAIVVPTEDTVVIKVEDSSDDGDTLRAYQ